MLLMTGSARALNDTQSLLFVKQKLFTKGNKQFNQL